MAQAGRWLVAVRMGRVARAATLTIIAIIAMSAATRARAQSEGSPPLQGGDLAGAPPIVDGKPIVVSLSLHVINLSKIDDTRQLFSVDGYLFERWKDPRLAFTPAATRSAARSYRVGQIWTPRVEFVNATAPRTRYDTALNVTPAGDVTLVERFAAELSARFNLRRYPFDSQLLEIYIHPFYSDANRIKFTLRGAKVWEGSEFRNYSALAQWDLRVLPPHLRTHREPIGTMSGVGFPIQVTRRSAYYLWKVFLPLVLMVCVSWGVFWIEPGDIGSQAQISVTTILTVIAFAFAISTSMPRVPYLTYIDAFFLECYVFVILAFVVVIVVHVTHRSDKRRDLGVRIRDHLRIIAPAAFVIANALIAIRFLG